jgi:thiosulfate dehydrogenase
MLTLLSLLALTLCSALLAAIVRLSRLRRQLSTAAGPAVPNVLRMLHLQRQQLGLHLFLILLLVVPLTFWWLQTVRRDRVYQEARSQRLKSFQKDELWEAPEWSTLELEPDARLIAYGRDLVARTGDYFGENGILRPGSINGLHCQNCHLQAGSVPFGNNYAAVASTYPKVRPRSGKSEGIFFRINDCFMRSLNGQPLDTASREMLAMAAYIRWLGSNVPRGELPKGSGLVSVPFLDRAADPERGKSVYAAKCASCHGPDGQGLPMPDSPRSYPPLWGERSYAESAGLFRLSRLAGYVKANMPLGATYQNPQLSDEEAWDVAAYINSRPRPPHRFLDRDWPDISKKPFDHPFGPYADTFPEKQHKFGPFAVIKK